MDRIVSWLEQLGPLGLFLGNILDSSFVGFCGAMDAAIIALCMQSDVFQVFLICFSCAAGSVIGIVIFYLVILKGKNTFLKKYLERNSFDRLKRFVEKYELPLMIFTCIAPPPFPFKFFIISITLFSKKFRNILLGAIIGRFFRFFFVGFASWYFGDQLKEYYPVVVGILVIMLIPSYFINRKLKKPEDTASS